jgi:glycosyltransferase involved in cell wall biosynthesis
MTMHHGRNGSHLAIYIHALSGGGAQRRAVTLANAFGARGHTVDLVVARVDNVLRPLVSDAVRVVELGAHRGPLHLVRPSRRAQVFASIPALVHYLRAARPDVMLSAASHVNLAAVCAHRLAGVQTRLVLRASNHLTRAALNTKRLPTPGRLLLARHLYPLADRIIAVSEGVAADVVKLTGVPRDRVETIYNPVVTPELEGLARAPVDHPWFAGEGPPIVLGAGRFVAQKDFSTLVKAFARVRAVRPARLMILGRSKRPARERRLRALAERLGIAADVALPGFAANPFAYMARASAFVLSSRWEGLPGVLIEAMACGCPVVSTDCPSGPREILAGGRYGPLVPVGDAAALAEAILRVLAAPPDRARLRARAAEFSVEQAVDRYLTALLRGRVERELPRAAHAQP